VLHTLNDVEDDGVDSAANFDFSACSDMSDEVGHLGHEDLDMRGVLEVNA
jgi:hypothetical protein